MQMQMRSAGQTTRSQLGLIPAGDRMGSWAGAFAESRRFWGAGARRGAGAAGRKRTPWRISSCPHLCQLTDIRARRKGAKKLRDVPRSRARGPRLCSGALTKARGRLRVVSCSDFVVWLALCPSEIRAARRQSGCRSWGERGMRRRDSWFVIRERVHSKEGPAREDGGRWKMEVSECRQSNAYYRG